MNLFLMNVETVQDANALIDAFLFLKAQFDALAPTPKMWAEYPLAQWYAIDASEEANWYEIEPKMCSDSRWHESATEAHGQAVPLGIDWRLCKWQRPEVAG